MRRAPARARAAAAVVGLLLMAPLAASCGGGSEPGSSAAGPSDPAEATRARFAGIGADQPGCSVAVLRHDTVVFAEAYGLASLDPESPNTPATVMDIASTSKQFTALAILMLADDGLISLDDDIREYVPELPDYGVAVTLRQMMHHQSGLPDYTSLLADRIDERTTGADALDALGAVTALDFAPGSRFAYSNSNYFLFSLVVERVAGMPLSRFLATRVFGPAGIAAVVNPVGAVPGKARSYRRAGSDWQAADSLWEQTGDGAIQTTPTQLVRWGRQYWAPTVGSAAVHRARLDGAVETPGGRYGAGIVESSLEDGVPILSHPGAWAGFVTAFGVIPSERLAVAATCNGVGELGPIADIDAEDLLKPWRQPGA